MLDKINKAKKIVILPSIKLERYAVTDKAIKLIEKLNVLFAVMSQDKSVIYQ